MNHFLVYTLKNFPMHSFLVSDKQVFLQPILTLWDEQAIHLAYVLSKAREKCAITVEPVQESIDEWVQTIIEKARISKEFQEQCTPGYYNLEGCRESTTTE